MGLAEPRKQVRTKISRDPNNTRWVRSETGYGHKILASQGWTPGSYLGARDAPQASSFTAASASHIRVLLKDDNLGLGAQRHGPVEKQRTGHDAFQGLLGRLNGKTDTEIERENKKRVELQSAHYLRSRWNLIQFVRGGLLVQEKIALLPPVATRSALVVESGPQESEEEGKVGQMHQDLQPAEQKSDPVAKKRSKFKRPRDEKKEAKCTVRDADSSTVPPNAENETASQVAPKSSKKTKRHDRRASKERQRVARGEEATGDVQTLSDRSVSPLKPEEPKVDSELTEWVHEPKPHNRQLQGMHALRNRHIAQKRRAMMDSKALDEIFAGR